MAGDGNEKLTWMYKGLSGHVDREEYLTGRKIDKTFELIRAEETATKGDLDVDDNVVPPSLFASASSNLVTADVVTKIREDPLYEIKRREIEKQKEILNNPLKLKRLKSLIEKALTSSSSSDSEDDDRKKRHKSKKHKKHKHSRHDDDSDRKHDSRRSERHKDGRNERKRSGDKRDDRHRDRSRNRSRSKSHDRSKHSTRKRTPSPQKSRSYSHHSERDRHEPSSSSTSSRSNTRPTAKSQPKRPPPRPKLSAEELEKRRQEMMSDAVSRDNERRERVEKIKRDEDREKNEQTSTGAGFIKQQLTRSFHEDTLEKHVKQKLYKS